MDAGEMGTFWGGDVLLIDVDHLHDADQHPGCAPMGKQAPACEVVSEDESTSVHQIALPRAEEARSAKQGGRRSTKRRRADDVFFDFEVHSPTSLAETTMPFPTPDITDTMADFFPAPPTASVSRATSSEGSVAPAPMTAPPPMPAYHTYSGLVGVGTAIMPPPPNADGVALGLPCAADMTVLQPLGGWAGAPAPPPTAPPAAPYCPSALVAPKADPPAADISAMLQEVLSGRVTTPPLGLKLDVAEVMRELRRPATRSTRSSSRRC